jgi:hypothetical protein
MIVRLEAKRLADTAGLLSALGGALGFTATNRDALVDALTHLDDVKCGTGVVFPGELVLIAIDGPAKAAGTLGEIAAFVNQRRLEKGQPPILALAHQPT